MSADAKREREPNSTSGTPLRRSPRTRPPPRHHGATASSPETIPRRPVTRNEDAEGAQQPADAGSQQELGRRRPLRHAVRECGSIAMARTASLASLAEFPFAATVLDPGTALQGLAIPDAMFHAWLGIRKASQVENLCAGGPAHLAARAVDEYLVGLGAAMMDSVPGPHFTFVDPRNMDKAGLVRRVKRRANAFRAHNIPYAQFVIGVPATPEGIEAAQEVARGDPRVRLNMLFVASFEHAKLCVEVLRPGAITFSCSTVLEVSSQLNDAAAAGDATKFVPEAPYDWVREVETTAAWLHLKKCRTQLLVADLCGTEIPLPAGVDGVVLGDKDIEEARGYGKPFIRTSVDESAVARARNTPYHEKTTFNKQVWNEVMNNEVTGMAAESSLKRSVQMMSATMQKLNNMILGETRRYIRLQTQDSASLAALYQADRTALSSLEPEAARRTAQQDELWTKAFVRRHHVGFRLLEMTWDRPNASSQPTVPGSKAPRSVLKHKRKASVSGTPEAKRVFDEAAAVRSGKKLKTGGVDGSRSLPFDESDSSTRQRNPSRSSSANLLVPRQARITASQASPEGAGGIENTSPTPYAVTTVGGKGSELL